MKRYSKNNRLSVGSISMMTGSLPRQLKVYTNVYPINVAFLPLLSADVLEEGSLKYVSKVISLFQQITRLAVNHYCNTVLQAGSGYNPNEYKRSIPITLHITVVNKHLPVVIIDIGIDKCGNPLYYINNGTKEGFCYTRDAKYALSIISNIIIQEIHYHNNTH